MASVWWITYIFLYLSLVFVKSDRCITYNFDNDVYNHFFDDEGLCGGLQGISYWSVGNYSEIGIESLYRDSDLFISPNYMLSCGSTFEFEMTTGGTIEVNVYMDSNSMTDQISLLAMKATSEGNDPAVGSIVISPTDSKFVSGWQTLSMTLIGIGTFPGYISFMGTRSEESLVLVDSFRYIPPGVDRDSCVIYAETVDTTETTTEFTVDTTTGGNIDTITEASTETQKTTTEQSDDIEPCVTYNFEADFDVRFSPDNYLCDGLSTWRLDNYTSSNIESPNPESTVFMTPLEASSCISSFVFKMEPGGIVEARVFIDSVHDMDHIIIIAQRVTGREYDTVVGFIKFHPGNPIFTTGWSVIRFSLLDLTSFDGYLLFIGGADKESKALVDSVRYIPPRTPPEDASCNFY